VTFGPGNQSQLSRTRFARPARLGPRAPSPARTTTQGGLPPLVRAYRRSLLSTSKAPPNVVVHVQLPMSTHKTPSGCASRTVILLPTVRGLEREHPRHSTTQLRGQVATCTVPWTILLVLGNGGIGSTDRDLATGHAPPRLKSHRVPAETLRNRRRHVGPHSFLIPGTCWRRSRAFSERLRVHQHNHASAIRGPVPGAPRFVRTTLPAIRHREAARPAHLDIRPMKGTMIPAAPNLEALLHRETTQQRLPPPNTPTPRRTPALAPPQQSWAVGVHCVPTRTAWTAGRF
jgi:hypothetical protein